MTCETKNKEIDGIEYSVTQWPAEKAILMKLRLVKAFGASLMSLISKTDQDEESLSDAISTLFENCSPEDLLALIKNSVVGVACSGTKITDSSFNSIFSGESLITVYKVFAFVLQVNYADLFKGQQVEELLAKVTAKT
jgi:hypothetical protein